MLTRFRTNGLHSLLVRPRRDLHHFLKSSVIRCSGSSGDREFRVPTLLRLSARTVAVLPTTNAAVMGTSATAGRLTGCFVVTYRANSVTGGVCADSNTRHHRER
jgi:hypothetical protein